MDCRPPGSSVHGPFQAREPVGCHTLLQRDPPHPGIEPMSPVRVGGFFTTSTTWEASVQVSQSSVAVHRGRGGVGGYPSWARGLNCMVSRTDERRFPLCVQPWRGTSRHHTPMLLIDGAARGRKTRNTAAGNRKALRHGPSSSLC